MDDEDEDRYWTTQQGRQWGSRVQESMREHQKVRNNPSPDDKKVRRRNRRATAGGDVQKRAELVRALKKAASWSEQARLLDELNRFDANIQAQAAQDRELDFADTAVRETLSPVRVHEHHTAATDWMGDADQVDPQWSNRVVAEAAMWFGRVPDFVKADREEFSIQAQGMARRVAGPYGLKMEAAQQTFLEYVSFLNGRTAASGLDQVQQTVDPHDNPKPTPLNPEVFDTFAPEVDPINSGVSGTEDSNRAPMIQEIMQGGSGADAGAPEKPGGHSVDDELSWAPPQGMQGDSTPPLDFAQGPSNSNPPPAPVRQQASLIPAPGMAISHTMNMDQYRARQARTAARVEALGKCTGCGNGLTVANAADREGMVCKGCARKSASKKEAASGLDQIQQTVDPHDNPKPTGLPPEVAFPLNDDMQEEWTTNGTGTAQPTAPKVSSFKQADMFGGGDAAHPTVGPANTGDPTPTPRADQAGGSAAGAADAQAGNHPSFADDSSFIPPAAQQYAQGYSSVDPAANVPQNVPPSLASAKVSSLLVTAGEMEHADFRKGYGYGSRWTPGTRLVSTGSKEFEAGVYAGISDNPENQRKFVEAHRAVKKSFPKVAARADQHKRVTARVVSKNEVASNGLYLSAEAASGIDMATTAPNTSPAADGSTPINGTGRPGPLNGQQDAAAPGGASPYNGAEPFGTPVVPGASQAPASPADALIGGGHMSTTNQVMASKTLAFRQRVQSSLLAERQGK